MRRDGGAPVSASTERLVASTTFIAGSMQVCGAGIRFSDIDGVATSGAGEDCLFLSSSTLDYSSLRAEVGQCRASGMHIRPLFTSHPRRVSKRHICCCSSTRRQCLACERKTPDRGTDVG